VDVRQIRTWMMTATYNILIVDFATVAWPGQMHAST
jgi:hypothetical protein